MKKKYILSILFAMAVASCKKELDQSVNPNSPSVASPQTILAAALDVTAVRTETDYTTFGIWMGYYAPSGNFVPVQNTETYTFTNSSFNVFNPIFANLANYNYLITAAVSNPALNNFAAISTIMYAYDFQLLVDNYDQVPYSQALNSSLYLFPKYDPGQAIYNDLMLKLDGAIAMIDASGSATNPGSSDIVFQGNMANWKKAANTMKLRLAIRQSNIAANKAGLVTELAKTSTAGYLDDATFMQAQPGYLNSDANSGQQNPYYRNNGYNAANVETSGHQQNRANSFFVNFMVSRNDTNRVKRIYAPSLTKAESIATPSKVPPNNVSAIIGNTFGSDATNNTNAATSALGPGIIPGPTAPAVIIAGSEACFLVSEAIVTGLIPGAIGNVVLPITTATPAGSAQDYYQRGITASFVALGATASNPALTATQAATAYYSQPVVDVNWVTSALAINANAPTLTLALTRAIQTQKYICLFGFEIQEAYNEFRRTGYPDLSGARSTLAGALGTATQNVPNRIFWPVTEASTNAVNYALLPAVAYFGTATKDKIFWMK